MYSRYPNYRFSGGMRLPENYSGNAFKPSEEENEEKTSEADHIPPSAFVSADSALGKEADVKESTEVFKANDKKFKLPGFNLNVGRIFSGGFGIEELLIIGIILLLSKNDTDDDIILLLALLLFIG
jgi:hypothetical protein